MVGGGGVGTGEPIRLYILFVQDVSLEIVGS